MTKNNIILLLFALVTAVVFAACTKNNDGSGRNPCLEPRKYYVKVQSFTFSDTGSTGVPINLPSPVIGYVDSASALDTNIIFYKGTAAGGDFNGPLSGIADSTRWFILPDTNDVTGLDTITFYYERKPVFLSTACGYAIVYSLQRLATTNNSIDSARIEKTEVNGVSDIVHVKIFY